MSSRQQYYEILGLDSPPADRKAVKRAYSKMLKATRPEDDPDGFMRLRDAHDIALSILARQAEQAAWEAQNSIVPTSTGSDAKAEEPAPVPEPSPDLKPSLTYQDLLPAETEEEAEDTSYSVGPTPNFDAPVIHFETEPPKGPPLADDLTTLLSDPEYYNDRERWNQLFRKARQLDIDEYVDFENLLFEKILTFYDYYNPKMMQVEYPGSLPITINQTIAASLFKTMSWDKVNMQDSHKNMLIEWLARRMRVRHITNSKSEPLPAPVPQKGAGNVWMWIIGAFILLKIIQALANA